MEPDRPGDLAVCPFEIARPVMTQRWERLTFGHWSYDLAAVRRLVPEDLEVEEFEGRAWVGLVLFFMRVGLPGGTFVPWLSNFSETNLRTYVRDPAGRPGIWFFSVDAARLGAVVGARTGLRLPYFWSRMRLAVDGARVEYSSVRRLPPPVGVRSRVVVEVDAPCPPDEVGERERFLTARWRLFSRSGGFRRMAPVCHPPWELHRGGPVAVEGNLLEAAGLPAPRAEPLVHYSTGVDVRVGRPERW